VCDDGKCLEVLTDSDCSFGLGLSPAPGEVWVGVVAAEALGHKGKWNKGRICCASFDWPTWSGAESLVWKSGIPLWQGACQTCSQPMAICGQWLWVCFGPGQSGYEPQVLFFLVLAVRTNTELSTWDHRAPMGPWSSLLAPPMGLLTKQPSFLVSPPDMLFWKGTRLGKESKAFMVSIYGPDLSFFVI
jgi:hypothetical protein